MTITRNILLTALAVTFSADTALTLTLYEPIGDMMDKAPIVVIATTGVPRTRLDPKLLIVYRDFPLTVDAVIKGDDVAIQTIAIPGGDLPNGLKLWVSDTPELLPGHSYVLFLDRGGQVQFGPAGALEINEGKVPAIAGASIDALIEAGKATADRRAPSAAGTELLSRVPRIADQPDSISSLGKWPKGTQIHFYYYPDFSGSSIASIDSGAVQWNNVVVNCVHLGDYGYNWAGFGYNGVNSILHASLAMNILAQTWLWTGGGLIYEFDLQFNRNQPWTNYCAAGKYDTSSVAVHELGHSLGLDHNGNTCSVMYPSIGAGQCKRNLCSVDVNNIRALYGCY